MSKFVDALQQARHENRRLFVLCLVLGGLALFAGWNWRTAARDLTLHIPPDLRNGATLKVGPSPEVPDTTVYTFAFYIWQQINHWQADGAKDYGERIFELQGFITPNCREQLVADMNSRSSNGELSRRTRSVAEIPGLGYTQERVSVLGGSAWKVLLDTQVLETQGNVAVKDAYIRYPLRVVRFDVDREKNPWQLAIDCFGGERPARLDATAVAVARTGHALVEVRTDVLAQAATVGQGASPGPTASVSIQRSTNGAASPASAPPVAPGASATSTIAPPTLPRPAN